MNGPEIQAILDSAEQAASSGDYALAESLLRDVARLQAENLGPKHPELASTFNNLGVVCERANKLIDAGRFYREALSIASASLNAEDPLVVTSRNNCNEFHRGLGLVDTDASESVVATPIPAFSESRRQAIVAATTMGVVLLGALTMWVTRSPAERPQQTRVVEQRLPAFGDPLVPAKRSVSSQHRRPSRAPASKTIIDRPVHAADAAIATMTISAPQKVDARVLEASLCQTLSTSAGGWECTPTSDPGPGEWLYFYTRIAAPTPIRIHHRWYRNGILRQDVALTVEANPAAGYRTYSQRRLETGNWRIIVVGAGDEVLGEENLEVR